MESPIIQDTQNEKLTCLRCNLTFANKSNLNKHLKSKKHLRAGACVEYKCERCNFITHDKTNWEKHLLTSKHRFPNLVDKRSFRPRLAKFYEGRRKIACAKRGIRQREARLDDPNNLTKDIDRKRLEIYNDNLIIFRAEYVDMMDNIAKDLRTVGMMLLQPSLADYINTWKLHSVG